MADLVSHPDEVKVVSKRFGKGATNIDRYLELDGYKAVQKALAMPPDDIINLSQEFRAARTRRRGIQHRTEVVVCSQDRRRSRNIFCAMAMRANPAPAKTG